MKIGVFGGTFDPPHVGHLVLAAEAMDQLQLDRVLWVLTPCPPHKPEQPVTGVELRMVMLQAAIAGEPTFEFSRVDIDRPEPHFARDTMQLLQKKHPGDRLIYLMGGDSLKDLPDWYKPREFLAECRAVGVMLRPGAEIDLPALEQILPGIAEKVRLIGTPLLEISSTDIRKRIAHQRHYRYFLPTAVYQIIIQNKLYTEQRR
jgi:nicotinate-nucleotide adenylyltransferase